MRIHANVLLLVVLSSWLAIAPTAAQRPTATGDDPFGGNQRKANPFQRDSKSEDPFGGDPFRAAQPSKVESRKGRLPGGQGCRGITSDRRFGYLGRHWRTLIGPGNRQRFNRFDDAGGP